MYMCVCLTFAGIKHSIKATTCAHVTTPVNCYCLAEMAKIGCRVSASVRGFNNKSQRIMCRSTMA